MQNSAQGKSGKRRAVAGASSSSSASSSGTSASMAALAPGSDGVTKVDPHADWLHNGGAPMANSFTTADKYTQQQRNVLLAPDGLCRAVVTIYNPDNTIARESAIHQPKFNNLGECESAAEVLAMAELGATASELADLVPAGGTLRLVTYSTPWHFIYLEYLKRLADLLKTKKALLELVSTRGSDTDLVTAAAHKSAFTGNYYVNDVRLFPLEGGGWAALYLVHHQHQHLASLTRRRAPNSFGNASDADVAAAGVRHGLQAGLLLDMRTAMRAGSGVNGLHDPLDHFAAVIKRAVAEHPNLVGTFYRTATPAQRDAIMDKMRARGKTWAAGSGANYVLDMRGQSVTVDRLAASMDASAARGDTLPLGALNIMAHLAAHSEAGNGGALVRGGNSGESGAGGKLADATRAASHVQGKDGNPLPMWMEGLFNSIEPGCVSVERSVYVAFEHEGGLQGLLDRKTMEVVLSVMLHTQCTAPSVNAESPLRTGAKVVYIGLNFISCGSPGAAGGNPREQCAALLHGHYGGQPLGVLLQDDYAVVPAAFMLHFLLLDQDMSRAVAEGTTLRQAYSLYCQVNGAKGAAARAELDTKMQALLGKAGVGAEPTLAAKMIKITPLLVGTGIKIKRATKWVACAMAKDFVDGLEAGRKGSVDSVMGAIKAQLAAAGIEETMVRGCIEYLDALAKGRLTQHLYWNAARSWVGDLGCGFDGLGELDVDSEGALEAAALELQYYLEVERGEGVETTHEDALKALLYVLRQLDVLTEARMVMLLNRRIIRAEFAAQGVPAERQLRIAKDDARIKTWAAHMQPVLAREQIGRASCRER